MKKFALLMALLMSGSIFMASCTGTAVEVEDGKDEKTTAPETTAEETAVEETTAEETAAEETAAEETAAEETAAEETTVAEETTAAAEDTAAPDAVVTPVGEYVAGIINDKGEFVNTWSGIKYIPSEGDSVNAAVAGFEGIYGDLIVMNSEGTGMAMITYEDASIYLGQYDQLLTVLEENWDAVGMVIEEEGAVQFISSDYYGYVLSDDSTVTTLVLVRIYGNYVETITFACENDEVLDTLLANFAKA